MKVKAPTRYLLPALMLGPLILGACSDDDDDKPDQPSLEARAATVLEQDGLQFKDLNGNGEIDPYEDWRLDATARADDIVARMTLAQKAGAMMHATLVLDNEGRVDADALTPMIQGRAINTFITRMGGDPAAIAADNNLLQQIAEGSGLGIPLSISSDPRNHFVHDPNATSIGAGEFSQWPETLGLAAIGDSDVLREFADIARQEYLATGIRVALHPVADLATEPRWGRINGTFGEDNELAKKLVYAYVDGFQHGTDGLNPQSVVSVVKHFAGGGPQEDGYDAHNIWGKEQVYPGNNFGYHLVPFEGAFDAHAGSVMPYYGQPMDVTYEGEPIEEVGFGFNKRVLTNILRDEMGFDGVVLSDWLIVTDCTGPCAGGVDDPSQLFSTIGGMPWGVEDLTIGQRYAKAIDAGVDQFGGVDQPQYIIDDVNGGTVDEARVNSAVKRIMIQKFQQGLFENPYVDEAAAVAIVGNDEFQEKADAAQRHSHVLLQNTDYLLPLANAAHKVYLYNVNSEVATDFGFTVVATPEEADLAIIRMVTPAEVNNRYFFGDRKFGRLNFIDSDEDYSAVVSAHNAGIPVIASVYVDRPVILTNMLDKADAIFANFGASDQALMMLILGQDSPQGHLPFELPSSMAEVEAQAEDLPHDTANPLFELGFGLSY